MSSTKQPNNDLKQQGKRGNNNIGGAPNSGNNNSSNSNNAKIQRGGSSASGGRGGGVGRGRGPGQSPRLESGKPAVTMPMHIGGAPTVSLPLAPPSSTVTPLTTVTTTTTTTTSTTPSSSQPQPQTQTTQLPPPQIATPTSQPPQISPPSSQIPVIPLANPTVPSLTPVPTSVHTSVSVSPNIAPPSTTPSTTPIHTSIPMQPPHVHPHPLPLPGHIIPSGMNGQIAPPSDLRLPRSNPMNPNANNLPNSNMNTNNTPSPATPLNPPIPSAPYTQGQTNQFFPPPRVHSAPPSLEEQSRIIPTVPLPYFPDKANKHFYPSPQYQPQYFFVPNPHIPSGHPHTTPSHYASAIPPPGQSPTLPNTNNRTVPSLKNQKRVLSIIDPNTGEEVDLHSGKPASLSGANNNTPSSNFGLSGASKPFISKPPASNFSPSTASPNTTATSTPATSSPSTTTPPNENETAHHTTETPQTEEQPTSEPPHTSEKTNTPVNITVTTETPQTESHTAPTTPSEKIEPPLEEKDKDKDKEPEKEKEKERDQEKEKEKEKVDEKNDNKGKKGKKGEKPEEKPKDVKSDDQKGRRGRSDSKNEKVETKVEEKTVEVIAEEGVEPKKNKIKRRDVLKNADKMAFNAATFDPYAPNQTATPTLTSTERQENATPQHEEDPAEENKSDDDGNENDTWETLDVESIAIAPEPKKETTVVPIAASIVSVPTPTPITSNPPTPFTSNPPSLSSSTDSVRSAEGPSRPPIKYLSDHWSPANPKGKKVYDRDFLLQFMPFCTEKPDLSEVPAEILRTEGPRVPNSAPPGLRIPANLGGGNKYPQARPYNNQQQPPLMMGNDLRYPNPNIRGSGGLLPPNSALPNPRMNPPPRVPPQKGMQKKGLMGPPGIIMPGVPGMPGLVPLPTQPPVPQVAPLQHSSNRWVRPNSTGTVEENNDDLVLRKAKGILNKITLEKFEPLSEKLLEIGLTTPEILKGIIFLVFEKALTEPKFSTMYANLCKKLAGKSKEFPGINADDKPITFKRVLLNKCQEEFESNMAKTKKKERPSGLTPLEMAEWEENEMRARKKMLGNIKFIGELYKHDMLTEKIMHSCIQSLLSDLKHPQDDDMEALCKLLSTIGFKIDHAKSKEWIAGYFERIKTLSTNNYLPPRIRFALQDLIELRKSKWIPRQDSGGPKTISEVHQDAAAKERDLEKERQAFIRSPPTQQLNAPGRRPLAQNYSGGPNQMSQQPLIPALQTLPMPSSNPRSGMMNPPTNPSSNADGWTQVGNKAGPTLGPKRPSLSDINLAPGGGGNMSKWGAGAGTNKSSSDNDNRAPQSNLYGAPSKFDSLRNLQPNQAHTNSRGPNPRGPQGSSSILPSPTNAPYNTGRNNNPRGVSSNLERAPEVNINIEKLETDTGMLVQEYLVSNDIDEAIACVKELNTPSYHPDMVVKIINVVLESREPSKEIHKISKLFKKMLEDNVIQSDSIYKGLAKVLEPLPDIVLDVPSALHTTSNILVSLLDFRVIDWSFIVGPNGLSPAWDPLLGTPVGADVFAEVMSTAEEVQISELQLRPALAKMLGKDSDDAIFNFMQEKELTSLTPVLTAQKTLDSMLKQGKSATEMVGWIDDTLGDLSPDPSFVRWLIKALLDKIVQKPKFEIKDFESYNLLLNKFISLVNEGDDRETSKKSLHLQVTSLFEVQNYYYTTQHDSPNKVPILQIFQSLYKSSVVSKRAFTQWAEDKEDNTPGKSEALLETSKWVYGLGSESAEEDDEGEKEDSE